MIRTLLFIGGGSFLGGITTFSTFINENASMLRLLQQA